MDIIEFKKLRPINGWVIVKDDTAENKTKSGIVLPENRVPTITQRGTVIESSNRKLRSGKIISPEVKSGDKILYGFTAGTQGLTAKAEDGSWYRIIKYSDIILKYEE